MKPKGPKMNNKIIKILEKRNESLFVVESCTGGLISHSFSKIPNASRVFHGGIVSYSLESKNKILNIPLHLLNKFSPYSFEILHLMLKGGLNISNASNVIALSGVAGPKDFENAKKGTIFIGFKNLKAPPKLHKINLNGSRISIQKNALKSALNLFLEYLLDIDKNT